jgi:molybdopterin converting factor small subunit
VSCFDRNNIPFFFSLLDMIVEMSRGSLEQGSSATSIAALEALRALLIADYKREQASLDTAERMRKSAQKAMDAIIAEFDTHFAGEDIEMAAKSDEVQVSSARVKPKTSTDIIDYDTLEKDRTVIGQRSKYYLEYGTTIQYFKNNYARNQKAKSLDQQVVISVHTSSSSK